MIRGHSFPKSPLSPGVPLEGTDTVAGLQQIARWKTAERFIETTGLHRDTRQQYERYKGPYLHQLTLEHLKQPPRPWPEFLYAAKHGSSAVAYNFPSHFLMLCERMEENSAYFLVNYCTIIAAIGLHVILQHPLSLLSIAASMALWTFGGREISNNGHSENNQQQAVTPRQQSSGLWNLPLVRWLLIVCAYVFFFMSRCGPTMLRCSLLSCAVVGLHAALRRAPSEYKVQHRRMPGVPFRDLLSGGRRGDNAADDPRRLFKEVWQALVNITRRTVISSWSALRSYPMGGYMYW